jgi:hypothetical protein
VRLDSLGHRSLRTLEETPDGATHWSIRDMGKASGLDRTSVNHIWRVWAAAAPQRDVPPVEQGKRDPIPAYAERGLPAVSHQKPLATEAGSGQAGDCGQVVDSRSLLVDHSLVFPTRPRATAFADPVLDRAICSKCIRRRSVFNL